MFISTVILLFCPIYVVTVPQLQNHGQGSAIEKAMDVVITRIYMGRMFWGLFTLFTFSTSNSDSIGLTNIQKHFPIHCLQASAT